MAAILAQFARVHIPSLNHAPHSAATIRKRSLIPLSKQTVETEILRGDGQTTTTASCAKISQRFLTAYNFAKRLKARCEA